MPPASSAPGDVLSRLREQIGFRMQVSRRRACSPRRRNPTSRQTARGQARPWGAEERAATGVNQGSLGQLCPGRPMCTCRWSSGSPSCASAEGRCQRPTAGVPGPDITLGRARAGSTDRATTAREDPGHPAQHLRRGSVSISSRRGAGRATEQSPSSDPGLWPPRKPRL